MGRPVVHFDIGCPDAQRSRAFYEATFGWTSEEYGPLSFKLNTGSQDGIHGFTTALGHEPHNYVMLYIEVEDIPRQVALIESNGGSIVVPETQVPGSGHFAWCRDPHGNLFGLWKPQS
ncbi:VOC family protein [Planctomycetaceae bacterium SH139]